MVINNKSENVVYVLGILTAASLMLPLFIGATTTTTTTATTINEAYGQVSVQTNATQCEAIQEVIDRVQDEQDSEDVVIQLDKSITDDCQNLNIDEEFKDQ